MNWNAKEMADKFLGGYGETVIRDKLKDYTSQICRLQRENIRQLASQRPFVRAAGYACHQMLMNVRLSRFLRRYKV